MMKTQLILLSIVLTGLLLRILFINSSPPSLYGDELTMTLDAYSLLKTGHDQLGNFMPLTFPMGAGRPAGYVYFSIPFIAIFGPTELGVRALSILSGIGVILLAFLICRKLFSKKTGLIAAFIFSVSPWDIALSRAGFETHFALFLALLGIYLFIVASKRPKLYILSAISFGLTLHTYPTYKVSLPLLLSLLLVFRGTRAILGNGKKYLVIGAVILLVLVGLSVSQTFTEGSETRFANINVFSEKNLRSSLEQKINFERNITRLPTSLAKYVHNKPVEYVKVLAENYLQNFSVDFLFIHGDGNPRHNMMTVGGLYIVEILLITVGFLIFWQKKRRTILFILFWLLLAPMPTAIVGIPHALRSSLMLPPLIFLSALGMTRVLNYKNKVLLFLILFLFIIQFVFLIQKLYFLAPNEYSNFWSYSAKLASQIVVQNKDRYDYIILSDRIDNIEFAYPVYGKIDPKIVISQNKKKDSLNGNLLKRFDNVYIGYIPDSQIENFISSLEGSVLYIGPAEDRKFLKRSELIDGLDGLGALVLEKKNPKL